MPHGPLERKEDQVVLGLDLLLGMHGLLDVSLGATILTRDQADVE